MKKIAITAQRVVRLLAVFLSSQFTWLVLFAIGGAAAMILGAFVLHGLGWALIVAGGFSMLFATVIFRGLGNV